MCVQSTHFWPNWPHTVVLVPGWQVPLVSQQPLLQVRWLHAPPELPLLELLPDPPLLPELLLDPPPVQPPLTQVWPDEQPVHAAPPVPQLFESDVPGWQLPFESQHPLHVVLHEAAPASPSPLSSVGLLASSAGGLVVPPLDPLLDPLSLP
jgi:hypothetical protein